LQGGYSESFDGEEGRRRRISGKKKIEDCNATNFRRDIKEDVEGVLFT